MKSIKQSHIHDGFTLIELIVVIILIAIMAAAVLPKFLTSNGFEEYTYRDELIIKLRAIQLRTMQQTNGSTCLEIGFTSTKIGLLAPELPCNSSNYAGDSTTVEIDDTVIKFSISENLSSFSFSSLGKPEGCAVTPCEITLTVIGESNPQLKINSEGYIYAL